MKISHSLLSLGYSNYTSSKSPSFIEFLVPWMHKTRSPIHMPTLIDHLQSSPIVTSIKIVEPSLCSSSYSFLDISYHPLTNFSRLLSHEPNQFEYAKSTTTTQHHRVTSTMNSMCILSSPYKLYVHISNTRKLNLKLFAKYIKIF